MSVRKGWLRHCVDAISGPTGLLLLMTRAFSESAPSHQDFKHELRRRPEGLVALLALLLVIAIGIVDHYTNPRLNFSLFYLVVVSFAAWFGGRKAGVLIAFTSSFSLFLHEIRNSRATAPDWTAYWNMWMQIGAYLFTGFLVSAVRSLTEDLGRRVANRTAELESEIGERKQTEEQLLKTMQQLRQLADNISDVFWMRNAGETRMAYVSRAYETIFGWNCRDLYQSPTCWLETVHPDDRERVARAMEDQATGGNFNLEYRIIRSDSAERWIRDRAFPVRDSSGRIIRIVGIAEDITESRRLEHEILEISDREQARIGQDLHDGLCQRLVSLAFDVSSLEQKLSSRGLAEATAAGKIGDLLDDVITEARSLSRGLFPVHLEAEGLRIALQQLASSTNTRFGIRCQLECPEPVLVSDNSVATHLYRIAQEAVNNAVKYANPGAITIHLASSNSWIELKISDDGVGIGAPLESKPGLGLHTMEYRARKVGGVLDIKSEPGRGTVIMCFAPGNETENYGERERQKANAAKTHSIGG